MKEFLLRIILAQHLCHMAIKVFCSIITCTTAMCKRTIIRLFSMTRIWLLFNFLTKVTCISPLFDWRSLNSTCTWFIQQIRLVRFQIFHLTKFTNGAHVMWFLSCGCFYHINLRLLCKIKSNKIKLKFNNKTIPFLLGSNFQFWQHVF